MFESDRWKANGVILLNHDFDHKTERRYLFCYKCGHLWYPSTNGISKRCPRCHSSKWDVPEKRMRTCKFCNHLWEITNANEVCPECGKRQTEGYTDRYLHCNQCDYDWVRKRDSIPKKCPLCRSSKWDGPKMNVLMCQRCRHIWTNQTANPKRCPHCQSAQWNLPIRKAECQRCGHCWIPRKDFDSKICPSCRSNNWHESPKTYVCPKCERVIILKTNKSSKKCPYCDRAGKRTFKCSICGNIWTGNIDSKRCDRCFNPILQNDESTSMMLWTDGRYVLRYVSSNGFGVVYLWDRNVPVSTVYMHEVCKKHHTTVEDLIRSACDHSRDMEWQKLSEEMFAAENGYMVYIDYFIKRLSISYADAKVLAIHFTGMGPEAIAIKFGISIESVKESFERIMNSYSDSGIVVDDTIFTENPFKEYGNVNYGDFID